MNATSPALKFLDFHHDCIQPILNGTKTTTTRLDNGVSTFGPQSTNNIPVDSNVFTFQGDFLAVSRSGNCVFANCRVVNITRKQLKDLNDDDAKKEDYQTVKELQGVLKRAYPSATDEDFFLMIDFEVLSPTGDVQQQLFRGDKLAPFNPTSDCVIQEYVLPYLSPNSQLDAKQKYVFMDLGCGDGRVMEQFAVRNPQSKCIGVEYDFLVVQRAKKRLEHTFGTTISVTTDTNEIKTENGTALFHGDVLSPGILKLIEKDAAAIFVFLVPEGMKRLAETLQTAVHRGCKLISYIFKVPGIEAKRKEVFKGVTIYFY